MKPAYSMWCWCVVAVSAGILNLCVPQLLVGVLSATRPLEDTTLLLVRLLGVVLIGYGTAYGVVAARRGHAYMRFSVLFRASVLPVILVMVALNWVPKVFLSLGILDLIGALWTYLELRQEELRTASITNQTSRNER